MMTSQVRQARLSDAVKFSAGRPGHVIHRHRHHPRSERRSRNQGSPTHTHPVSTTLLTLEPFRLRKLCFSQVFYKASLLLGRKKFKASIRVHKQQFAENRLDARQRKHTLNVCSILQECCQKFFSLSRLFDHIWQMSFS